MPGVLDALLEGFDPSEQRGFHGRWIATILHPVHGLYTSPVDADSSKDAWSKAESKATAVNGVVQSVVPHAQERGPTWGDVD